MTDNIILDIDNIVKKANGDTNKDKDNSSIDPDTCTPENPLPCQHKVGLGMTLSLCKDNLDPSFIQNIKQSYIEKSMSINQAMNNIMIELKNKDNSDKAMSDTKELIGLMKLDLDISKF